MGEQPHSPIKLDRSSDYVLDSAINYYNKENPKLPYKVDQLFLDNGAFSANMADIELKEEKIIDIQEKLEPDKTIPLDYPFKNGLTVAMMEKRWKKTAKNIRYWQSSTTLHDKLVPALHAWSKDSLKNNLRWLQKHGDAEYLAVGSIVSPEFVKSTGFFGDRQPNKNLIDMLTLTVESVRSNTDFKIHLMGLGSSPLTLHFGYYLGIESTDSAGYRRKAAYGQIVLPGTGERYVGNNTATFGGGVAFNRKEMRLLQDCDCPVCRVNQDELWNDWKARAIHNDHVMRKERELAQNLMDDGVEAYEEYLDDIYKRSSFKYLWDYTKLKKKYNRISTVLFGNK
jgi:tRNA-guanine family transglycosylase